MRNLVLILGDQLDRESTAFDGFDPARDGVLMIEAAGEAIHVWSHKARIALFLSAMRHFAGELRAAGIPPEYLPLDAPLPDALDARLLERLHALRPRRLVMCEPGEWRVMRMIESACAQAGVTLDMREDRHFLCSRERFAAWARGRRELRMELFYRDMRRRTGVLMEDGAPAGGRWNFDVENRRGFGREGPGAIPPPPAFAPDALTREVLDLVRARFSSHPGSLERFAWPVTRAQARASLDAFVRERLPVFGRFQDAMWTGTPFGWHSLLSASLNLKLLDPREVIDAAIDAWRAGKVPLASVEGFVRQILGWREFMRGVYWLEMPALAEANHFGHTRKLPVWFWTADTGMNCLRASIGQTLVHGYAHHIQRLMVIGNFALLAGLDPQAVSAWYLAVYVDAVEWVQLPNTAGMALYANGGRFTSKPYVASGAYIGRMSDYCRGCSYRPDQRTGKKACPFTVLYWRFLDRQAAMLACNPRTSLMVKNRDRIDPAELRSIRRQADRLLDTLDAA